MRTIIFCGGGSMGHVTKHFAVLPHLIGRFDRFVFVGSETGPERDYIGKDYPFYALPAAKLTRGSLVKNLTLPKNFLRAERKSREILSAERPSVVFCGGGYVSVPMALAAKKLKIPVALHESDRSPGLANRLCLPLAEKVFTTFPDTFRGNKKAIYTGAIIREDLFSAPRKAKEKFGFTGNKKTLLVIGGSLGSKTINENIASIYDQLCTRFNVLHICGGNYPEGAEREGLKIIPFTKDMASVYAASDLAVSRCGSNTAFELMAFSIPTLFVPLSKKASRGDQIENAEYFENIGAAMTLSESLLTPSSLLDAVYKLESDDMRIRANIKKIAKTSAAKDIADALSRFAETYESNRKTSD